jgi:HD-like signal output (HDOD) protein
MEAIHELLQNVKDLPPTPQVLIKVLGALRHEQVTIEEIGDLISYDPALTGKLLHYCNSVYFSGREPVSSVPEAIGRVGFKTIFVLVSAATGSRTFNLPPASGLDAAQLWKHSLTAAFGCKFVAEDLELDGNMLFTAGLLHDVGRVILCKAKGHEYGQIIAQANATQTRSLGLETAAYGFTHADVGGCLMAKWQLPPLLIEGVQFHHRPMDAGESKKIAACVCIGNLLSHFFDQPTKAWQIDDAELRTAMELLEINDHKMKFYDEQIKENWDFVNSLILIR